MSNNRNNSEPNKKSNVKSNAEGSVGNTQTGADAIQADESVSSAVGAFFGISRDDDDNIGQQAVNDPLILSNPPPSPHELKKRDSDQNVNEKRTSTHTVPQQLVNTQERTSDHQGPKKEVQGKNGASKPGESSESPIGQQSSRVNHDYVEAKSSQATPNRKIPETDFDAGRQSSPTTDSNKQQQQPPVPKPVSQLPYVDHSSDRDIDQNESIVTAVAKFLGITQSSQRIQTITDSTKSVNDAVDMKPTPTPAVSPEQVVEEGRKVTADSADEVPRQLMLANQETSDTNKVPESKVTSRLVVESKPEPDAVPKSSPLTSAIVSAKAPASPAMTSKSQLLKPNATEVPKQLPVENKIISDTLRITESKSTQINPVVVKQLSQPVVASAVRSTHDAHTQGEIITRTVPTVASVAPQGTRPLETPTSVPVVMQLSQPVVASAIPSTHDALTQGEIITRPVPTVASVAPQGTRPLGTPTSVQVVKQLSQPVVASAVPSSHDAITQGEIITRPVPTVASVAPQGTSPLGTPTSVPVVKQLSQPVVASAVPSSHGAIIQGEIITRPVPTVASVAPQGTSPLGTPTSVPVPVVAIRRSETASNAPRQCWICFATDEDDLGLTWIQPCKCKGTTKWVHQSCLQLWIDEKLKEHRDKKVACPQCKTEYLVFLPNANFLIVAMDKIDNVIYRVCPFIAAGVVIGTFYWNAVTYGALVVLQVGGAEGARQAMDTFQPTVLLVGLPFVPLCLIVFRLYQWEDSFLHFLRTSSRCLPVLNCILPSYILNETGVVTEVPVPTAMSFQRVLAGALLTPLIAKFCGNLFFGSVPSPVYRTFLGGAAFIGVKGLIKMYHKQQIYKRLSRRKILDYTEENKILIAQSQPLTFTQIAPTPFRFHFVATIDNPGAVRR